VPHATEDAENGSCLAVQSVLFSNGIDPEISEAVFEDKVDVVGCEGVGVARLRLVHGEMVPVKLVQSVDGAEPHEAAAILNDFGYQASGETLLGGDMFCVEDRRLREERGGEVRNMLLL